MQTNTENVFKIFKLNVSYSMHIAMVKIKRLNDDER